MRLDLPKSWFRANAASEAGLEIGAGSPNAGEIFLNVLRNSAPEEFARLVRAEMAAGRYEELLQSAGVQVESDSAARGLGKLCGILHGARRNEFLAAFFDEQQA